MTVDPAIYTDYRAAKKAAAALAAAVNMTLLQNDKGKPRVVAGKMQKDFPTWLAAWSWLHRVHADQQASKSPRPIALPDTPPATPTAAEYCDKLAAKPPATEATPGLPAKAREPPKPGPAIPLATFAPPLAPPPVPLAQHCATPSRPVPTIRRSATIVRE